MKENLKNETKKLRETKKNQRKKEAKQIKRGQERLDRHALLVCSGE